MFVIEATSDRAMHIAKCIEETWTCNSFKHFLIISSWQTREYSHITTVSWDTRRVEDHERVFTWKQMHTDWLCGLSEWLFVHRSIYRSPCEVIGALCENVFRRLAPRKYGVCWPSLLRRTLSLSPLLEIIFHLQCQIRFARDVYNDSSAYWWLRGTFSSLGRVNIRSITFRRLRFLSPFPRLVRMLLTCRMLGDVGAQKKIKSIKALSSE